MFGSTAAGFNKWIVTEYGGPRPDYELRGYQLTGGAEAARVRVANSLCHIDADSTLFQNDAGTTLYGTLGPAAISLGLPTSVTGNVDVTGNMDVTGTLDTTSYITGKKCGVFAHLPTPTATTCVLADTWYPISGAFVNVPMECFAISPTPAIIYVGKTQYFEIDWHASFKASVNTTTAHIGIAKNGTVEDSSIMGDFLKFANEIQTISGTTVIELASGDEIQLIVMADGAGDVITIQHFTTTICKFFD